MLTVILHRFPADDHSGLVLPTGVGMFCLPMGASVERWPMGARHPLPVFSTFVLTSDVGLKIYGAAIVFYDDFDIALLSDEQLRLFGLTSMRLDDACEWSLHQNRAICFLSRWPFYEAMRGLLLYIYRISVSGPQPVPLERYVILWLILQMHVSEELVKTGWNRCDFGRRWNVLWQSISRSSDSRLFHAVGPEMEKVRPPSFVLVLTVTADLVVDDVSRLLAAVSVRLR